MPRRTETWEGCRWTRVDPLVNVVPSEPTDHQLLFRNKWTVVTGKVRFPQQEIEICYLIAKSSNHELILSQQKYKGDDILSSSCILSFLEGKQFRFIQAVLTNELTTNQWFVSVYLS